MEEKELMSGELLEELKAEEKLRGKNEKDERDPRDSKYETALRDRGSRHRYITKTGYSFMGRPLAERIV